jgi:aromatic-L-amino-acid/L-tryptophan decarboxylase
MCGARHLVPHRRQNSRGFRALKVWLGLRHAGRTGYARMIGDDIALAKHLHARVAAHPELEAATCGLSICTFRYVPADLVGAPNDGAREELLDRINREVLDRLQKGGDAFVSNAVVNGRYLLRACIVNINTAVQDIEALPEIVARVGRQTAAALRASAE